MTGERRHTVYRDAISGEYTTKAYAEVHPDTTVAEQVSDAELLAIKAGHEIDADD